MASIVDPGKFGLDVPTMRAWLKCDVAVVKGGHYAFNVVGNTSIVEGAEGYAFGHVVAVPANGTLPDAAGRYDHIAWAESDGAVGDIVRFTIEGIMEDVLIEGSTAIDDVLISSSAADRQLDKATGTSEKRIIAKALTVSAANLATCLVSGWVGMGFDGSSHT